ncbi:short-chain dehydrogenase, partial [Amaricoccus sp. HAR-UPW-R2A-40]
MGLWALTRTAAQGLAPQIRVNEPAARAVVVNMIDQRVLEAHPRVLNLHDRPRVGLWALTRTAAQGLAPQIRVN